ncbi:UNVERIFIED_ORG: hypothetical protein BCL66_103320 [Martelella mediterranea]
MGAVSRPVSHPMAHEDDDTGFEPVHTSSPTDHVLTELQLYGWRPFQDEADPRPLPEGTSTDKACEIFVKPFSYR